MARVLARGPNLQESRDGSTPARPPVRVAAAGPIAGPTRRRRDPCRRRSRSIAVKDAASAMRPSTPTASSTSSGALRRCVSSQCSRLGASPRWKATIASGCRERHRPSSASGALWCGDEWQIGRAQVRRFGSGAPICHGRSDIRSSLGGRRGQEHGDGAVRGGTPSKEDLDAILPDRPVFLLNRDVHGACQQRALRRAGIDAPTSPCSTATSSSWSSWPMPRSPRRWRRAKSFTKVDRRRQRRPKCSSPWSVLR